MKNLIINIFKTLFFFDLGFIIIYNLPQISFYNSALSSLLNEMLALAVILVFNFIFFRFVERKKLKLINRKLKFKSFLSALGLGALIPLVFAAVLTLLKKFDIAGLIKVKYWYFWVAALFVNVIVTELFLRGYLFSLFRKHYGFITATVVTTLLYVTASIEILKLGKIYVANMILFSILLCLLLEFSRSLRFNVIVHFVFSFVNVFLLGGLSIWHEYPLLLNVEIKGKALLTGGETGVENSVIMLVITSLFILLFLNKKYNLIKQTKRLFIAINIKIKEFKNSYKIKGRL